MNHQQEQQIHHDESQEQVQEQGYVDRIGCLPGLVLLINKPYILITIPVLVGGVWLANNPNIITNNLDKPYMLAIVPTAVLSVLAGWLVLRFFRTIEAWCKRTFTELSKARKEGGSDLFFWCVIAVFMIVSVLLSGDFFSKIEHSNIPGLGQATALFIDLVAVQCMRARLGALRIRDKFGAMLYLLGVLMCAGTSAYANTYSSLSEFSDPLTGSLPPWMHAIAPWSGMIFPALIVLLSITADYTVDQTNSKLDANKYREQEQKRVDILEVRRDMHQKRLSIEQEIERITQERKHLSPNKKEREFLLVRWLFPKKPLDMNQVIDKVTEQLNAKLDEQKQAMQQQIEQVIRTQYQQDFQVILAKFEQFENAIGQMKDAAVSHVLQTVRDELQKRESEQGGTHKKEEPSSAAPEQFANTQNNASQTSYRRRSGRSTKSKKRPAKSSVSAYDQVLDLLKKNRQLGVTEICNLTGLSKGTVSPIRTKILNELNTTPNVRYDVLEQLGSMPTIQETGEMVVVPSNTNGHVRDAGNVFGLPEVR